MKTKRYLSAIICITLLCAIALNLNGCSSVIATNLMDGITPNAPSSSDDQSHNNASVTDFAIRLFKASNEQDENTLISPLSVLCALSMTANGAKGETREQMEAVLGMTVEELNLYLHDYIKNLPEGEKYKLLLANSVWFTNDERFTVNQDFLQTNADYYNADVYQAPFDRTTLNDINNWVKNKTDGMIPDILDDIPYEAVMYLVNALAFEAEWTDIYLNTQVRDGQFTNEDGSREDVEFMYNIENVYLEDEKATGFMKYYSGKKYAFVALLPNEDLSVSEYIDYLCEKDGALSTLLSNKQTLSVNTAIPKFETEYDTEMSAILSRMGMPIAFDRYDADFSGIGSSAAGNIYINRVIHKTYISVGEKGTKAGAATVVEMTDGASGYVEDPKKVYLDRPFVYMLVDCENNIPFFIGTMMDIDD